MVNVPWFIKIPAKIILSRLPVGERTWQRVNLFRAGGMDSEAYARSVFDQHYKASGLGGLHGCTILELGPGNGLLTGKFAGELGATRIWLVDSHPIAEPASFPNTTYLSDGLKSLRMIPDASIDFAFSNAVLEHVRKREFGPIVKEIRRVLKPRGVTSHQIDFRDHLQYALNNLRFSERTWESEFMANSGFYTNRLSWAHMKSVFEASGFAVQSERLSQWDKLPTPRSAMAQEFRDVPLEELLVMDCHAVLTSI